MIAELTIMVNNQNRYLRIFSNIPLPPSIGDADNEDRKIGETPLWDIQDIVAIAKTHSEQSVKVRMVTNKADRDYGVLTENGFDLNEILSQMASRGRYKGSWWCKTSPAKDKDGRPRGKGAWVPCDAYEVTACEYEHPVTGYRGKADYYLKMCKSITGTVVLFVSLHL